MGEDIQTPAVSLCASVREPPDRALPTGGPVAKARRAGDMNSWRGNSVPEVERAAKFMCQRTRARS